MFKSKDMEISDSRKGAFFVMFRKWRVAINCFYIFSQRSAASRQLRSSELFIFC